MLFAGYVKAQTDTAFYFFANGIRIDDLDKADDIRMVISPDRTKGEQLYTVKEFYKDGKLKIHTSSIGPYFNAPYEGPFVEYYPTGRKKNITNYKNGAIAGEIFHYFPNGKLYAARQKDAGGKLLMTSCRDTTGKVYADNGEGEWLEYDNDFKKIIAQGAITHGLATGEWTHILSDTSGYTCIYKDGILVSGVGYDKAGNKYPFTKAEEVPVYKTGTADFINDLSKRLWYPSEARTNKIQGRVFISFVIRKDGTVGDAKVLRGIGYGCDEIALKAVLQSTPWVPGKQFGMPVNVLYNVPIAFNL